MCNFVCVGVYGCGYGYGCDYDYGGKNKCGIFLHWHVYVLAATQDYLKMT